MPALRLGAGGGRPAATGREGIGMDKPRQGFAGLWNISFGFFGIQIGFALQNANMSRVFQSLGSSIDDLSALWVAAPLTGLLVQPVIGHLSDRTWLGRLGRRRPYFLAGAILAAIALLAMQMVGTFMPLVVLPSVTFQDGRIPYGLTMEGQYIVKNLLIISAALVIGGTVRGRDAAQS